MKRIYDIEYEGDDFGEIVSPKKSENGEEGLDSNNVNID